MNERDLYHKLMADLNLLQLPITEVEVEFRPYSKTYYGRYFPKNTKRDTPRIFVYPYENTNGEFMPYDKVLETAIHEFIHHLQYSDHNFKRKKGIMHDPSFWKLYNHYIKRADSYDMLEVSKYEHKADVE